jgi:hypothetical protein
MGSATFSFRDLLKPKSSFFSKLRSPLSLSSDGSEEEDLDKLPSLLKLQERPQPQNLRMNS